VTTCLATSSAACARSTKKRPNACCVDAVPVLDHLKRVIDRIRRTGKVTGTKTLIVLGSTLGSR
jgi:hypothetical protein